MRMTFPCAASSRRTGSGEWKQWTAFKCESVCRPGLFSVLCLGASRGMMGLLCLSLHRLTLWLPDSLTTWEIHGLSLSKTKGDVTLSGPQVTPLPFPCTPAPCSLCS